MKTTPLTAALLLVWAPAFADTPARADCAQPTAAEVQACKAAGRTDCEARNARHCEQRSLEQITVVGTRFGIDVDKYPGSASVLGPDDLDSSPDLIRALDRVPGIDTGLDNGRAAGQQYSIRGFGYSGEDRVIVMQDGVRRSTNLYSNQTSSFRMDSDLLKQVDIVRGSSSISHGGGAIGGVIGTTTKDARDFLRAGRSTGGAVNLRYDSNNQRQGSAALAYAPDDSEGDVLLFVKRAQKGDLTLAEQVFVGDRGFKTIDNDEDLRTLFFKAGWSFAPGHRLSLSHYDYQDETAVTWQSLYHQEYSTVTGPVLGSLEQRDTVLRYTGQGGDLLDFSATAYATRGFYDRGYAYVAANGSPQALDYRNQDERRGFNLQNLMRFDTGGIRHRLLLGFDYEHREEDADYVLNGEPTAFGSMPNRYRDLGVFAQHELALLQERLVLQLGGRYDRFDREVRGVPEGYDNSRFSPRVGASFAVMPRFNLLLNYSETFRAPTPHETSSSGPLNPNYWYLPNADLGPETSTEYEAGFSWRRGDVWRAGDEFRIKTMYFTGRIDDMIALVPDTAGPTPPQSRYYATYRNIGQVDRQGLELESHYQSRHYGLGLTYERLDQVNARTGEVTPWAFADSARLALSLFPSADDLSLEFDLKHWFKPEQNPETLVSGGVLYHYVRKSFTQAGFSLRWRPQLGTLPWLDGSSQILFGVSNLFDQKRLHPANVEGSTRVGLGRNVYVSLSKQF